MNARRYVGDATVIALLVGRATSPVSIICLIAGSSTADSCCTPVGLSLKANMDRQLKWALLLVCKAWGPQPLGVCKGFLPQIGFSSLHYKPICFVEMVSFRCVIFTGSF